MDVSSGYSKMRIPGVDAHFSLEIGRSRMALFVGAGYIGLGVIDQTWLWLVLSPIHNKC
jgi:hypothetical protein